jgi:TolA-binding protein
MIKIIYIIVIAIIAGALLWFLINFFIAKNSKTGLEEEKLMVQEAQTLLEEKKYEDAIKKYHEILTRFPESPDTDKILFSTGMSYLNLKKYDESVIYFQKLVGEYPKSQNAPEALYELMVAYSEKGDIKNMQDSLIRLSNNYPNADGTLFSNAKNIEMKVLPSILLQGAEVLFKLKKNQEALNLYQLILKDYPSTGDTFSRIIIGIGLCQENLGNETEAIVSFQKIADNYPESAYASYAFYYISRIYQGQKNYTKAKEYCKAILDNYPSAPQWISDKAKECLQK